MKIQKYLAAIMAIIMFSFQITPAFADDAVPAVTGSDSTTITAPAPPISTSDSTGGSATSSGSTGSIDINTSDTTTSTTPPNPLDVPVLSPVTNRYETASKADGVTVNYSVPTVSDADGTTTPVTCSPASGSLFAVGTTSVTCSTKNFENNSANTTFWVFVTLASSGSVTASTTSSNTSSTTSIVSTIASSNNASSPSIIPPIFGSNNTNTGTESSSSTSDNSSSASSTATTTDSTSSGSTGASISGSSAASDDITSGASAFLSGGDSTAPLAVSSAGVPDNADTGTIPASPLSCPVLTGYVIPGRINQTDNITRLQTFLDIYDHANLAVTGDLDQGTINAIKVFQAGHLSSIMGPWGLKVPSGDVYITTLNEINSMACGTSAQLTAAQIAAINNYKNQQTVTAAPTTNTSTTVSIPPAATSTASSTGTVGSSLVPTAFASTSTNPVPASVNNNASLTGNALSSVGGFFGGILSRIKSWF